MQFKRFVMSNGALEKIRGPVSFPLSLSRQELGLDSSDGSNMGHYRLVAVIEHIGESMHAGHYVAYIHRAIEGKFSWYRADDSTVSPCSPSAVLQAHAYILLYEATQSVCTNEIEYINMSELDDGEDDASKVSGSSVPALQPLPQQTTMEPSEQSIEHVSSSDGVLQPLIGKKRVRCSPSPSLSDCPVIPSAPQEAQQDDTVERTAGCSRDNEEHGVDDVVGLADDKNEDVKIIEHKRPRLDYFSAPLNTLLYAPARRPLDGPRADYYASHPSPIARVVPPMVQEERVPIRRPSFAQQALQVRLFALNLLL